MDIKELTKGLSAEQRKALMEELSQAEQQEQIDRRETYEALRRDFLEEVKSKVLGLADVTKAFRNWLDSSARGFYDLMREYGHLRNDGQLSFSITEGDFKLEVRSNKVKGFDERADVAAERLIEYLKKYISNSTKGADDPMYQLAMSLLARNRQGALDYKSISKLYELEDKFDGEYKAIMDLFRESNVVQQTAINYYFWVRDENKVWNRLEPSFCRL